MFAARITLPQRTSASQKCKCRGEMQAQFAPLRAIWRKRGFDLDLGIGIAPGYATPGAIGFGSGRAKQVPTLQRKASFPRIFQYPFLDHIGDLQVIFAHHHHVNVARDAVQ